MLMSILVSLLPVDERVGPAPLAPAAIVNSFSAEPVAVIFINSAPLVSKIAVPIFGEVKVLFVKVCVPVRVTSPKSALASITFVPSV